MLRGIALIAFVSVCTVLAGRASVCVRIAESDSLRQVAATVPPEDPEVREDAEERTGKDCKPEKERTARERKGFLRRIVRYFEGSNVDRTFEKKIDVTFAGGPSFSKNTSLGIGLLAAGLYRLDRTDSVTVPSDVSVFANVSVSGFYALGVTGNTIFAHNRQRVNYTVMFSSAPRSLWGIGYDAGRYNPESTYSEKHYLVEASYLHEVLPRTYVGGIVSFEHTRGVKFSDQAYLYGQKRSYTATGIGLIVEYDSRDFIPNPYRGVYVSFQERFFPKGLGNCERSLWRTTFTADAYRRVWKGGILAADLYAVFNSEGTPWPMLARLGRQPAHARLLSGTLYGQRHDYAASGAATAHLATDRLYGVGRRGQRLPFARPVRLVAHAAQLRRRTALGAEEARERPARLRVRQEDERVPAEYQRSLLTSERVT